MRKSILLALSPCVLIIPVFIQAQTKTTQNASILLPAQENEAITAKQAELSNSRAWQNFLQKNGRWSVLWNEATKSPHRAFGPAIQITDINTVTRENIQSASLTFIKNHAALLKVDPGELKFKRATQVKNKWYVSYTQIYEELEVLFSELELRIFADGKVAAFGADFYPDIRLSTVSEISVDFAKERAKSGLTFDESRDQVRADDERYILPVVNHSRIDYHLVYKIYVKTIDPLANYLVYVDAHTGDLLWRVNQVRELEDAYRTVQGTVYGEIQALRPSDPVIQKPLDQIYVKIGEHQIVTDSLGQFLQTLEGVDTLTAALKGPWVQIINQNNNPQTNREIKVIVTPHDTVEIRFDDSNSNLAARNVFYHTNIMHEFITRLDPEFTNINYSVPVIVNDTTGSCNARWDGAGMIYYQTGSSPTLGTCTNPAQNASIIYHEYTHGITDRLYRQLGAVDGMLNGATHEALADVGAALFLDDPGIAREFFPLFDPIRNISNDLSFPEDYKLTNSSHSNGLILAGAFWDLRTSTSLEHARRLAHFAKYGLPDDLNDAVAFSEWFVEVLIADDDDGDPGNGAPNLQAILQAFNKHGIGASLFMQHSFAHTPLQDTQNMSEDYPVGFSLSSITAASAPDSVYLHYSIDNFKTRHSKAAVPGEASTFQTDIPAQNAGTIVKYYFTAREPLSGKIITFPENAPERAFEFLVGFNSVFSDEFEEDSGWTVGDIDDDADNGLWERGDPENVLLGNLVIQPNEDFSENGRYCFVTGANVGFTERNNVTNGKTTLLSPLFDLSGMQKPVIRYYKWYSQVDFNGEEELWQVDISNDGGQTWSNVENSSRSTLAWEKVQFAVSDFVEPTKFMQLRFVASDYNRFSFVEALIDNFEILNTIADETPSRLFPEEFNLSKNYPNPFNLETKIQFAVPELSTVTIRIFNMLGQLVRTFPPENNAPGNHIITWDGRNDDSQIVANGVYFYRIVANSASQRFSKTQKMLLLK